jgi:hypothetical protein
MVFGFASSATAFSSDAIQMIDGSGDGMVDIAAFDTSGNEDFNFGFFDDEGFQQILSAASIMGTETFYDGDIVDFAIQSATDSSIVYRLTGGSAVVTLNADSTSAFIAWNVGDSNTNVITRLSVGDTFSMAYAGSAEPVPEPTAAVTFAAGLMLAGWRIRRQRRA